MKLICVANNSQTVVHERPGGTGVLHIVKPADAAAVAANKEDVSM
jgi:hypothetical protein